MDLTPRTWDNYKHALWRVKFIGSLQSMHERMPRHGENEWERASEDYAQRLALAVETLAGFPDEWAEVMTPPAYQAAEAS